MNALALATRNEKEAVRNPLSLALNLLLPPALLLVLESFGGGDIETLSATFLAPGVALFGFVMLMFTSSMLLARDRETALFDRLRSAPLRSSDFVVAYGLPAWSVAALQSVILLTLGWLLGMDVEGSLLLVAIVLVSMAVFYVALGLAAGAVMTVAATTGAYTAVLLLTVFGGAWFDLDEIGGPVKSFSGLLPFSHALDAMRAVLGDGAGIGDIAGDLAWVGGYTAGAVALAVAAIDKRMRE